MPNNLPQGWVECQLGDICNLDNGSKVYNVNLPLLDVKYLRGKKEAINVEKGVLLNNGDFVILVDGENSGEIFSICEQGIMGSTFKKLIFSDYINVDFAKFKIMSKQKMFKLHKVGSAIPHLNKKLFKSLQLLLPPLNEQRRIVEKIESEFAKIDEGLEHLELVKEQIKQYRQSVLKSAFSINNKNEKCLDEITNKINDGTHKTPTYIEKGIPFISVKDIRNKQIFFDNCKFISEDEHQILFKRCNPEYGDVLITKSGTIGRTAIVNTNKIFDLFVSVALLKPKKDLITSEFLMYALDNYIVSIDVKQEVKGGVIKNLHIEDLKKITICLPPLEEQKMIVEEIEKRFAVADEVEKVVEDNIEKAKQLKQSILKKAFEGRLVPQDPTDEPASKLLEKIKQGRNKNGNKT